MSLTVGTYLDKNALPDSISSTWRKEAGKFLQEKYKESMEKIVAIDGTKFSDTVQVCTDSNLDTQEKTTLYAPGIDGLIFSTTQAARIINPVGDCGLLVAYLQDEHNREKVFGSAHMGYKWVIASGDLERNGIIDNFIKSLLTTADTKNINDFTFSLAPLAGRNFELPLSYFISDIRPYIEKQNKDISTNYQLAPENFIKDSKNSYPDKEKRIYFNLKGLILYVLQAKYKVYINNKHIDLCSTTDPKNTLASFRSYTLAKNIPEWVYQELKDPASFINKIMMEKYVDDLNIKYSDEDIFEIMNHYDLNFEQVELLLYGTAQHYRNTNSRLSLDVFTYNAL